MREKEEQRELRKYTYALLRVRLPDGCLLQGSCLRPRGVAGWPYHLAHARSVPHRDLLRPGAAARALPVCARGAAERLAAL